MYFTVVRFLLAYNLISVIRICLFVQLISDTSASCFNHFFCIVIVKLNVLHILILSKPQWMTIEGWGNKSDDRPQTPGTPPASGTPPVEGTPQRRGDFTRQEYERRQQLKIMEDLDKVLRQKPTTVRGVKKQRPKTVFRDDSVLSHSPVKGFIGK